MQENYRRVQIYVVPFMLDEVMDVLGSVEILCGHATESLIPEVVKAKAMGRPTLLNTEFSPIITLDLIVGSESAKAEIIKSLYGKKSEDYNNVPLVIGIDVSAVEKVVDL